MDPLIKSQAARFDFAEVFSQPSAKALISDQWVIFIFPTAKSCAGGSFYRVPCRPSIKVSSGVRSWTNGAADRAGCEERIAAGTHVFECRPHRTVAITGQDDEHELTEIAGSVDFIGVLRWPEVPGLFTPNPDTTHNIWFSRDSAAIAAAKGIDAAPFYIELESPNPPGGLPRAGRLQPNLPNNHLQYALTWFGLAAVLTGVYATWLFGGWRRNGVLTGT